jgi:glutamyl-tRNA synthetase/glutamyl-Q tRNA(Asp) synthetase
VILRLEDLDPVRCRPEYSQAMVEDLAWLGLEWDAVVEQHQARSDHEAVLDRLAELGALYPCRCSRAQIRASGERSPDGGTRYAGTCRGRALPASGGWRATGEALRVRLPEGMVLPLDEGGLDLAQDPAACFGDPVVRRRDGALAYHLACVVDDHWSGVTRVVRGRDLSASTATQVLLQRLLDFRVPVYRHHLLLLEPAGGKLAKFHGSVGTPQLRTVYEPEQLCGLLAQAVGLRDTPHPLRPDELLRDFSWQQVQREDRVLHWNGKALELREAVVGQ